jgi:hypothetical protein
MRVTWGGAISPSDRWSCSIWFLVAGSGNMTNAEAVTNAANLTTHWRTYVWLGTAPGILSQVAAQTTHDQTTVSYYGTADVLTAQGVDHPTATAGTSATVHPAYVSQVASLRTAAFGRSARGRIYLPMTAAPVSTATLQFTTVTAATAVKNLLTYIKTNFLVDAASDHVSPVVVSQTHGTTNDITTVLVDSLPDTQHGRQSKAAPASSLSATV